jgi:hypothetical protein
MSAAPTALFLVVYDDEDGDDMDLIVEARDQHEAARLWRQHHDFTSARRPNIVFEIPPATGRPGARPWAGLGRWTGARV